MDKYAELEKLAQLKEKGILSDEEFIIEKKKLLNGESLSHINKQDHEDSKGSTIEPRIEFQSHPYYRDNNKELMQEYWPIIMYLYPKGRINRYQFIMHNFLLALYSILLMGIFSVLITYIGISDTTGEKLIGWFSALIGILWSISQIALYIKRFHDINQSGWFTLIPIYNMIAALFFPGNSGDNRFGPPPK